MGSKGRLTKDKDVNDLIASYEKIGWEIKRHSARGFWRLYPPAEVKDANPDQKPFVMIHGTPSDRRHLSNLQAQLARYVDPRNTTTKESMSATAALNGHGVKYFCRTCGQTGPEFDDKPTRDLHEESHEMVSTHVVEQTELAGGRPGKHLWGPGNPPPLTPDRQCPFCSWNKSGKAFKRHIEGEHPDLFVKFKIQSMSLDQIEAIKYTDEPVHGNVLSTVDETDIFSVIVSVLLPQGLTIRNAEDVKKMDELKELVQSLETVIAHFG